MLKSKFLILITALLLAVGLAAGFFPAVAGAQTLPQPIFQAGAIQMSARAAFDGYFKYGEWLPVWVELENSGPDTQAEVRIAVTGGGGTMIFSQPVELPNGAHKRLPIYALPNNFSRQLVVELVSGNQTLASQKVSLQPNPTVTYLVGLASPERNALALLETIDLPGQTRPVKLVDLSLGDIPEKFEGLRSFDLLVLNGIDTSSLSAGQTAALEGWVRQGGRLVVGGGASAPQTAAGLPASLLPVSGLQTFPVDSLPGLEQFIAPHDPDRPIRVPGPFVAAAGELQGGVRLASQAGSPDDLPLVQEWILERGFVDFVAIDLSGSPFDAWNGALPFWEVLVTPGAIYSENAPMDVSARQQFASGISYPLSNLPMLDLPSIKGLAGLLGLYVLLVGPINYFVLRRQKRLHLAWVTIPALTLLFSAASFGLGYALHGTDIFVNKIAIVQLQPSGKASVSSFVGLFTPSQEGYEVQVRASGLISPLGPYNDPWNSSPAPGTGGRSITLIQGEPAYVRGQSVEQWSMQSFMAEGMQMDFGVIESDLRLEGDRLVGEIRSRANYPLKDVMVVLSSRVARLGELAPGGTVQVDLELVGANGPNYGSSTSYMIFEQDLSGQNGPTPRGIEVRRAIVENIFERIPPYIPLGQDPANPNSLAQTPVLLGWLDTAPPEVQVTGSEPAQQTTALAVMPLSYHLPESGPITLPPGLIPGQMVETPREGGPCGMNGSTAVYINHGDAFFEFHLPPSLKEVQIDNLKLGIWTDSGLFTQPTLALYDWVNQQWLLLEGVNQGVNLIPTAQELLGPDGLVRVRLSADNAQSCYYLGLGLEGRK